MSSKTILIEADPGEHIRECAEYALAASKDEVTRLQAESGRLTVATPRVRMIFNDTVIFIWPDDTVENILKRFWVKRDGGLSA